jgi:hypothetical protein
MVFVGKCPVRELDPEKKRGKKDHPEKEDGARAHPDQSRRPLLPPIGRKD